MRKGLNWSLLGTCENKEQCALSLTDVNWKNMYHIFDYFIGCETKNKPLKHNNTSDCKGISE